MIEKLRAARAAAIEKMEKLNTSALAESRSFTADEQVAYEGLNAEQSALKAQIATAENMEKLKAEMSTPTAKPIHAVSTIKMGDNQILDETGFASLGEFMQAVKTGSDSRLDFVAQSAGTGSEGGFLIPKQFGQMITAFTPETSLVRPKATVIPSGDFPDAEISFPALDQSGTKGVYSGVVTTWLAEGADIDETAFSLREITMSSKAVAGYIPFSNKLLRNAAAASAMGTMLLRQAVAKAEDDAFINGNGVGKPLGFMGHASAKAINRNTANTLKYVDLVNMLQASKGDMKEWTISQTLISTIMSMEDGAGRLIFTNGMGGMPAMLLGYPVRFSERTPTKGSKGDVMLLDLSYYYIKDGSALVLSASEHVQFVKDKTLFKIVHNVDGQSSMNSTLKLENGETVSPFVILDIPAA